MLHVLLLHILRRHHHATSTVAALEHLVAHGHSRSHRVGIHCSLLMLQAGLLSEIFVLGNHTTLRNELVLETMKHAVFYNCN